MSQGSTRRHDIKGHFYADDMQCYVLFDIKDNPSHKVHRMGACIKDIKMWMAANNLKLNNNKTEVITFMAPNVEMNMTLDVIQICDCSIPPVHRTNRFSRPLINSVRFSELATSGVITEF